jgi:hypothetical protein
MTLGVAAGQVVGEMRFESRTTRSLIFAAITLRRGWELKTEHRRTLPRRRPLWVSTNSVGRLPWLRISENPVETIRTAALGASLYRSEPRAGTSMPLRRWQPASSRNVLWFAGQRMGDA